MPSPAWTRGAWTVTTDESQIDTGAVLELLRTTHWAPNLSHETLTRSIRHSIPFALMEGAETVGFARVVTDRATFAYLCDVVVAASHRGRGLGRWLVECVLEHPDLQGLRRVALLTRDAPWLYERLGFTTDTGRTVYMERRTEPPPPVCRCPSPIRAARGRQGERGNAPL